MALLSEIYGLTAELLNKRDGSGSLNDAKMLLIKNKFPAIATIVSLELAEMNNIILDNPLFTALTDSVDLPDFTAYAVMPYGMAAEITRQGGETDRADVFYAKYEQMKKKIRIEAGQIEDTENALYGLGGRC